MTADSRCNLELKARCTDLDIARQRVRQLDVHRLGIEVQTDTYFHVPHGRLKLRSIEGQPAVLIAYDRPDIADIRTSWYHLVAVSDPAAMRSALAAVLGIRGEVHKHREIFLYHNVRIHLDEVTNLGTFIEFEAVQSAQTTLEQSQQYLTELSNLLSIQPGDCIGQSYADLLGL